MTEEKIVIEAPESTVVAQYEPLPKEEAAYQSEAALEQAFIRRLQEQAYQYLPIHTEAELIGNLRRQIEALNDVSFTDGEWERLFRCVLCKQNSGIEEKNFLIQEDNVQHFVFDDGREKNILLFDKQNVHNNRLQVINQYTPSGGARENRYDVTILVNGLPLVHVELKRRGVPIREAFNQINRYQRESFWSGSGLFEFVQIFVISNGTQTKYYSNTTRQSHVKEMVDAGTKGRARHTSNSFEFTSWWADERNRPIMDLQDFTRTFFAKHTLLNVLGRYCIFTSERMLMVMRPYQICATEKIINRINLAHNYHYEGSLKAGGYIWHTTGSGKTLTSFKTARLTTKLPFIDKVLFVVDRKDLDYQTMKEYDRFEKNAANSNSNSNILRRQLMDSKSRLIITTIQKLSAMLKNRKYQEELKTITLKQVVFIFDECHRSQFGQMHTDIVKNFRKYYIFGFTGTPIIPRNMDTGSHGSPLLRTTDQAFGDRLHTYTIVDAIRDKNVLPFRVEYVSTIKEKKNIENAKVWSIDTERALSDPRRISLITKYILDHFAQKTKRNDRGFAFRRLVNVEEVASARDRAAARELKQTVKMIGFNSIFAVSSIDTAKLYYTEFRRQNTGLKVALIYSYGVNDEEDPAYGVLDESSEDTNGLSQSDRDFLEQAIGDYNRIFHTNYDTSAQKFQSYYKDVSMRMKNRDLDLLIVVNMFLTGFDATTLNTLWVDKNLKMHGLLQAYSRTNRILNSIKTFGNIVCFRNLEEATNEAISLYGNPEAGGLVLLRTYDEYYLGYDDQSGKHIKGYAEIIGDLLKRFPAGHVIEGEQKKREFVRMFGMVLRLQNILQAFDQFRGNEILTPIIWQDYLGMYNDIYQEMHPLTPTPEKDNVNDDLVFEMELVKQVEINIDFILDLVKKYQNENQESRELTIQAINRAVRSSPILRDKKELIDAFIETVTPTSDVDDEWSHFVRARMEEEIRGLISTESLREQATRDYIRRCFAQGYVETSGTDIARIMPPLNPFDKSAGREQKKKNILFRITNLFHRFYDLVGKI